ncbi:MAG: LacI family DNA-binding transcriptional regulator [Parasphingorhabdus sp.]|nr:LacI family DNA-binding transcriptional regulator [Parasphingorhabdus sp.]
MQTWGHWTFDMGMNQRSGRSHNGGATIADVAKEANFSPMTVSRVINGEKNVRESTRRAVMQAVEKLNYTPNLAARSLAGADQIRIGLLYSNPSAAYLSRFLMGSLEQARLNHVQLLIEDCADEEYAEEAIRILMARNVDGIILSPPLCDSEPLLEMIEREGILAVVIANWQPQNKVSVIRIDDVAAAAEMTRHIIAMGHRRIGFIKGNPAHKASSQRFLGFAGALDEAGIECVPEMVVDGKFTYRSGLEAAEKLLAMSPPPTAIFASNDDMAAAAITVAHRHQLNVPGDLTVCGFDDTDFAQSIWPELTTIHQPIAEMSRAAIDMLVDQVKVKRSGRDWQTTEQVVDFTFIRRDSDAGPKRT